MSYFHGVSMHELRSHCINVVYMLGIPMYTLVKVHICLHISYIRCGREPYAGSSTKGYKWAMVTDIPNRKTQEDPNYRATQVCHKISTPPG